MVSFARRTGLVLFVSAALTAAIVVLGTAGAQEESPTSSPTPSPTDPATATPTPAASPTQGTSPSPSPTPSTEVHEITLSFVQDGQSVGIAGSTLQVQPYVDGKACLSALVSGLPGDSGTPHIDGVVISIGGGGGCEAEPPEAVRVDFTTASGTFSAEFTWVGGDAEQKIEVPDSIETAPLPSGLPDTGGKSAAPVPLTPYVLPALAMLFIGALALAAARIKTT